MSKDLHRQAELFMADADILRAQGRPIEAAQRYHEAATLELAAFEKVPHDRSRTRGVVGVSAVALYKKAAVLGDNAAWFPEALHAAYSVLASGDLPDFAESEIVTLIEQIRREQSARQNDNRTISEHGFGIFLHGVAVYPGMAPVETVVYKLRQFTNYFTRVAELIAGKPFRKEGPPPEDVTRICSPLISQPTTGSFQFELRFDTPYQLSLFDNLSELNSRSLVGTSYALIEECVNQNFETFHQRTRGGDYTQLLLRMVKNIAPASGSINRIDITRLGDNEDAQTILTRDVNQAIEREIRQGQEPLPDEDIQVGILRALDLNRASIWLERPGERINCKISKLDAYEDLIGPYVNHMVRVTGAWKKGRGRVFLVRDLQEADNTDIVTSR